MVCKSPLKACFSVILLIHVLTAVSSIFQNSSDDLIPGIKSYDLTVVIVPPSGSLIHHSQHFNFNQMHYKSKAVFSLSLFLMFSAEKPQGCVYILETKVMKQYIFNNKKHPTETAGLSTLQIFEI